MKTAAGSGRQRLDYVCMKDGNRQCHERLINMNEENEWFNATEERQWKVKKTFDEI